MTPAVQKSDPPKFLAAWLVAFFSIAFGLKLWVIQIWATDIPYWDQWGEAKRLFEPWLEGSLAWQDLFAPHNEHRIFFTRLLDLLELKLNGQWDPLFQMLVNAAIHVASGCGLAVILWHFTGRKYAGLVCVFLLPLFALPFDAENTIRGFQSQMYFANIFSLGAILGLGFGKPAGGVWFCGLIAAVFAIFTMASGFLAAAAVVGLVVLRLLKQHRLTRGDWLTLLSSLAVVTLGLALTVTVPGREQFHAKTAGEFLKALSSALAWPYLTHPEWALFFCLPPGVLLAAQWRHEFKNPRAAEFALALGLFVILQCVMLAYGRATIIGSSRYQDTLCLLPVAGFASLFILMENLDFARWPRWLAPALTACWIAMLMPGVYKISRASLDGYLRPNRASGLEETENVRAFIATDDADWLKSKNPLAIPHPKPALLVDLLRQPKILSIMPADIRKPLALEPEAALSAGFFTNGCLPENPGQPFVTAWGNFTGNTTQTNAHFVSRPMSASLPELSVQVYEGASGVKIRLTGTDGDPIDLVPKHFDRWETLIVDAPKPPFVLSVDEMAIGVPTAIGAIKELGRFSVLAQNVTRHAILILSLGLSLCLILTVKALVRPGISAAGERLAWVSILLVVLTALAGTYGHRNVDPEKYDNSLRRKKAADFAATGHPALAGLYLREALWLQPGDAEARNQLALIKSRGLEEKLPENNP